MNIDYILQKGLYYCRFLALKVKGLLYRNSLETLNFPNKVNWILLIKKVLLL